MQRVAFSEPITVFNDDVLVLDIKQGKVLVLNQNGLVVQIYQFKVENNGQRITTGHRQNSRIVGEGKSQGNPFNL